MIDTVVLSIPNGHFIITDHTAFQPHSSGLFHAPFLPFIGSPVIKCVQNPSKQDFITFNYKPRLTLMKRIAPQKLTGYEISLKIEFSVPKLLYGNNFQEVSDTDFERIIIKLYAKLIEMRVMVPFEHLRAAKVSVIHYGKNIVFEDFTTASSILQIVGKANYTHRLDLNRTHFRNEGDAVYFYAKSHCFVLYDKIKDLQQAMSRSVEQEKEFNLQTDIFDAIRRIEKIPIEILRLEMRICDRRKRQALLKAIGEKTELTTFEKLFRQRISQKILLRYWSKVAEGARAALLSQSEPERLFEAILKDPKRKPQQALALYGFSQLLQSGSARALKNLFQKRFCDRTFDRLLKNFEALELTDAALWQPFQKIEADLRKFEKINCIDYKKINDFLDENSHNAHNLKSSFVAKCPR